MNTYISGKTVYENLKEIRKENKGETEQEIRKKIEEYISLHHTVLTIYGSFRAYKIEGITFDKTPLNTSFNLFTKEGKRTVSLSNYYQTRYKVKIKDLNQPLLIAQTDKKTKKLLGDNKVNDERVIYLVPELLYITGLDMDKDNINSRRDIMTITKTNPTQRMAEINKIHNLYNSKN